MEELSQDDLRVVAYSYALSLENSEFGPTPDLLPNAERMRKRGWLSRRMVDGQVFYRITPSGYTLLEGRRLSDPEDVCLN